jgi:hypothetical protein
MAFFSHRLCARSLTVSAAATLFAVSAFGQATAAGSSQKSDPAKPPEPNDKRVFGIIPNYRTFPTLNNYKPITPNEKFKIAMDDSFDRGTVVLAAAFAGEGQLTTSNSSFGQGGSPILITGGAGFRTVIHSNSNGGFAMTLPYGRYRLSGDVQHGAESSGMTVFVAPLQTTRLDLVIDASGSMRGVQPTARTPGIWTDTTSERLYPEAFSLPGLLLSREPSSVTEPLRHRITAPPTIFREADLSAPDGSGCCWTVPAV